ncbi:MAG: methionyl-tRNA formyltransferase [Rhodospirillaceae bacterium]|nr:methionyl-tRNA formyltransferase [Rhodospirillaceae bacterium]
MTTMRLVFMGTPEIAVPALAALIGEEHEVVCVYSQPPRPAGRGHRVTASAVHTFADENGIDVRTPENFKSQASVTEFAALDADIAVVMAYGLILPQPILTAPRLGCVNIHASLLPRWRGAAPIQRAIMAGDTETGVTIMQMDEGLDTGEILLQEKISIDQQTNAQILHDQLAELGASTITRALTSLSEGSVQPIAQPDEGAVYAKKIGRSDGHIDWSKPAVEIERTVRALNPWPGTWFNHQGERIRILAADIHNGHGIPGTVLDDNAAIACGDGAIRPRVMQRPGKAATETESFLRGYDLPAGTVLDSPLANKSQ